MPSEIEYGCSASVKLTLRVRSKGHWGASATVAEVQRIGGRETLDTVNAALRDSGLHYEIIGEPEVGAVTWEHKK